MEPGAENFLQHSYIKDNQKKGTQLIASVNTKMRVEQTESMALHWWSNWSLSLQVMPDASLALTL